MANLDKKNHGGKRPNAGKKKKYGEETVLIGGYRVPKSKSVEIDSFFKNYLKQFEI